MIKDANNPNQRSVAGILLLAGLILLLVLNFSQVINAAQNIYGVVFPLLLGAAIAYVLNMLVSGYEKIFFPKSSSKLIVGTRRGMCIVFSILTIVLILLLFLRIVIPQFGETIRLLAAGFPDMYNKVLEWAEQHADQIPGLQQKLSELNMDGQTVLQRGLELLGNWAFGTVTFIGAIFSKMVSLVLAIVFGIYILFDKEELKENVDKLLKAYMRADRREILYADMRIADETFSSYIAGQCKEAVILGILCTIGMFLFSFPYAITIGPVIGLTALIPMIGAYIGAAVGLLLIVMVDPLKAVLFIVFIVVLQQLEGNIIYPKVVGESIGLPGIWVFAAIAVGGGLMGIAGVLLGVPVAATVYKLLGKSVHDRLNTR